jgi:hypothetical protein
LLRLLILKTPKVQKLLASQIFDSKTHKTIATQKCETITNDS